MAAAAVAGNPPNQTLYVRNLNERLHKDKLKRSLYAAFSQFGPILDVVALKTYRLRGQAWVVFTDVSCASTAKQQMQGFTFFDQAMDIQFAKGKSDAVAKLDGTYKPRPKRKREDGADAGREGRPAPGDAADATAMEEDDDEEQEQEEDEPAGTAPQQAPQAASQAEQPAPPHRILLATQLPEECNSAMLQMLFQQYAGFQEVRMVPGRGMAFVEFDNAGSAGVALHGLKNFKLTASSLLRLAFSK